TSVPYTTLFRSSLLLNTLEFLLITIPNTKGIIQGSMIIETINGYVTELAIGPLIHHLTKKLNLASHTTLYPFQHGGIIEKLTSFIAVFKETDIFITTPLHQV